MTLNCIYTVRRAVKQPINQSKKGSCIGPFCFTVHEIVHVMPSRQCQQAVRWRSEPVLDYEDRMTFMHLNNLTRASSLLKTVQSDWYNEILSSSLHQLVVYPLPLWSISCTKLAAASSRSYCRLLLHSGVARNFLSGLIWKVDDDVIDNKIFFLKAVTFFGCLHNTPKKHSNLLWKIFSTTFGAWY